MRGRCAASVIGRIGPRDEASAVEEKRTEALIDLRRPFCAAGMPGTDGPTIACAASPRYLVASTRYGLGHTTTLTQNASAVFLRGFRSDAKPRSQTPRTAKL